MYSTKCVCRGFRTKAAVKLYVATCVNDVRHTSNLYAFGFEFLGAGHSETLYCCQIFHDPLYQLLDSTRGYKPELKKPASKMRRSCSLDCRVRAQFAGGMISGMFVIVYNPCIRGQSRRIRSSGSSWLSRHNIAPSLSKQPIFTVGTQILQLRRHADGVTT